MATKQISIGDKQLTLDRWVSERFLEKLKRASIIANSTGKPFILYRSIVEETDCAVQEEVGIVGGKYVVIEVFTYGGFLPASFQQQYVFTLCDFCIWIMERSRELFFMCINNLEQIVR